MSHKTRSIGRIGFMKSQVVDHKNADGTTEKRNLLTLRVASEDQSGPKDDKGHRNTTWLTYKAWNGLGQTIEKFYSVGDVIDISGRLQITQAEEPAVNLKCKCGKVLEGKVKKSDGTLSHTYQKTFVEVIADGFEFVPGVTLKKQAKTDGTDAEGDVVAEGEEAVEAEEATEAPAESQTNVNPAPAGSDAPF